MKHLFSSFLLVALIVPALQAQHIKRYTTFNLHSHNDYQRQEPFYGAVNARFGSFEADIYLLESGQLVVAHDTRELPNAKTLEEQYIVPMQQQFAANGNRFYKKEKVKVQFLIDLKTGYKNTLPALIALLKKYPQLFDATTNRYAIRVVVSGAIPPPDEFGQYDPIVQFDGRIKTDYTPQQLTRIGLISDSFQNYSPWRGSLPMPQEEFTAIKGWIDRVHRMNKPVRFWATPDTPLSWETFMKLGVDYINTDHAAKSSAFINEQ